MRSKSLVQVYGAWRNITASRQMARQLLKTPMPGSNRKPDSWEASKSRVSGNDVSCRE